ncbi:molybdopterin guanine dinucleotide-containing S/N-oxide reductase [Bradyrhizobium sp. LHD-71]|uniref:molybdopterin guanine dinucleotide-containing S/N-oxide reductase n=1 Tax=Bradyrhizobium sp. LHD-71 TaxID=3072141 RepID=UPI00280DF84B|nr:molybdopterin guanine dinucleotide-containing S/N-oxide reductase [Bradyrhizobium sp. LHD-71]MDQ8727736.1 molybdopterin guanine dinucleotide-containing S/N-oxide reductase [Bradyrhizobium sp. LHD-71]
MTDVVDEALDGSLNGTLGGSHSSHWGAFKGVWQGDTLVVTPHPRDPDPNPIIQNFPSALRHRARIDRPYVRRGWLEGGPGKDDRRGRDEFVAMEWDEVLDLLASELARVRDAHGPGAIFGGSYGWSSAGRFHHAQSQIHRFLNTALGGYVRSVNSYSAGASNVLLPHILGGYDDVTRRNVSWDDIVQYTDIVLAFGGMAAKNSRVASGGISEHTERKAMGQARARGTEFVLVSPQRSDLPREAEAEWIAPAPGTDVALMLGIAHTLVAAGLHDRAFLDSHCVGWSVFEDYLMGRSDGEPKTAAWAAPICGIAASEIEALARRLAGKRVLIVVSHSMQRSEHGEQPVWMGAVLAAMLGQMGLPGGGYNYALGAVANYGKRMNAVPVAALPQGQNAVRDFIPVARISDMLLNPGKPFDYNGQRLTYPDIKLVYWAGGNPFHHHQDINRLRRAFFGLETLVVHEIAWTATARHADIVLPCTMTLEREDIGATPTDQLMIAMHRLAKPFAQARDDYDIFAALAERLGQREAFTEGRSTRDWLRHIYATTQKALATKDLPAPDFDHFWGEGELELPALPADGGILRAFRDDPQGKPLPTPSGKIEIFSKTIAGFGYADCPGHPAWLAPSDVPDEKAPLHLVANQPATRLHSQFDFGGHSDAEKLRGREVMSIHSLDAAARGIKDGDIVRLFNARGACLAAASVTDDIRVGVVRLPTGAWYDPEDAEEDNPLCVHGNPNVLTRDIGTSSLAQGCCGQLTTVQVERFTGNLPPIRTFDPPASVELRMIAGRTKS